MPAPWYRISNVDEIPSPALVVYPQRVRKNIQRVLEIAGDPERLRPHIKTHKCSAIVRMHLEVGVKKFKCATIPEAEMAARAGAEDVLIALQLVGPNAARFEELRKAFPSVRFSTICDNTRTAEALSEVGKRSKRPIPLFLDLDCGMARTGIQPGAAALRLFKLIVSDEGLEAAGLHAYDGHIHDASLKTRERDCATAFSVVDEFAEQLKSAGMPVRALVAGGTPTFAIHAKAPGRECSPGTYVFWDFGYQKFSDLDFSLAALVVTRVISKPAANRLCLDLGHKAIASENPQPRAQFLNLSDATPVMHSEEHLVIETPAAKKAKVGDVLYAVPRHICPTVALHDFAYPVENGEGGTPWKIEARTRRITF